MHDHNGTVPPPADSAPPEGADHAGYSTFAKAYIVLMAAVALTISIGIGWGTYRVAHRGFMSFATERLVEKIEAGSPEEAAAAADEIALSRSEGRHAIRFLVAIVADPEASNRAIAARVLGDLHATSPDAIEALTAAIGDSDSELRHAALNALAAIGGAAERAIPAVVEQLRTGDQETKLLAVKALGSIGYLDLEAEEALVATLDDPDRKVQVAALSALVGSGAELPDGSIAQLTAYLSEPDREIRSSAIHALAELGQDAAPAIPGLVENLSDESPEIRTDSAWALGMIGEPMGASAIPALTAVLNGDPEAEARENAAWAIGRMGRYAEPAAESLIAALSDTSTGVQEKSYEALKSLLKAKGEDFAGISQALEEHELHDGNCGHHDIADAQDDALEPGKNAGIETLPAD